MDKDRKHDYENPDEGSEKKMKRSCSLLSSNDDDAKMVINDEVYVQESTYKCSTCGKTFSNGKALGGHRRSHVLKKKSNHHQSQGSNFDDDSYDDGEEIDGKKKLTCYVCKKKFPTKNALYGHMRSHPDRVSKGVSPPSNLDIQKPSSSNNYNSSTQQNEEDDIGKLSLPKWKKKDKRGRKCIGSAEAAINLLHLRSDKYFRTLSIAEPKSPECLFLIKKINFWLGESSSNVNGKIGNKSDGNGDESDNSVEQLNRSIGPSESTFEETASNHSEQKSMDFDLNVSYVMED